MVPNLKQSDFLWIAPNPGLRKGHEALMYQGSGMLSPSSTTTELHDENESKDAFEDEHDDDELNDVELPAAYRLVDGVPSPPACWPASLPGR